MLIGFLYGTSFADETTRTTGLGFLGGSKCVRLLKRMHYSAGFAVCKRIDESLAGWLVKRRGNPCVCVRGARLFYRSTEEEYIFSCRNWATKMEFTLKQRKVHRRRYD